MSKYLSYWILIFVFLAFFIIVMFNYYFTKDMEYEHLDKNAKYMLTNVQADLKADLLEPEILLNSVSQTVRLMILDGANEELIKKYIKEISDKIIKSDKRRYKSFGAYGYFDVFDGTFINDGDWILPKGYAPKERAWYKAAIEADGEMATTKSYLDARSGEMVFSYSICIFDEEYKRLAVLSLDVPLERITQKIESMRLTEGGYGFLSNKNKEIIIHPSDEMLGKNMDDMESDDLIIFSQEIDNGWYLSIVTPAKEYYGNVTTLMIILSIIGFCMAFGLSFILFKLLNAKNKTDEYAKLMFESMPMPCELWNKDFEVISCNLEALRMFEVRDRKEFLKRFYDFSPKFQPGGRLSKELALEMIQEVFHVGYCRFEWMHQKLNGEHIPCEMILVRTKYKDDFIVAAYTRDLRK